MKIYQIFLVLIAFLGAITAAFALRKELKELLKRWGSIKNKKLHLAGIIVLFITILIISYVATVGSGGNSDQSKKDTVNSFTGASTSTGASPKSPISTDQHVNTEEYNPYKIDSTIQVITIDRKHLKEHEGTSRGIDMSEAPTKPGYGRLIFRNLIQKHEVYYLLDFSYSSLSLPFYDATQFRPRQEEIDLEVGLHFFSISDSYGPLDTFSVYINDGEIKLKYLMHNYSFGAGKGRLKIVPNFINNIKSRKIMILTVGSGDTVAKFYLKNKPIPFLLEEGEYDVYVYKNEESEIERNKMERVGLGAGHTLVFPINE